MALLLNTLALEHTLAKRITGDIAEYAGLRTFYHQTKTWCYEGCSNMNACSFITFVTYMLRQDGIPFYKGFYVIFKLAPYLKKNTVHVSSYSPLYDCHFSLLTKVSNGAKIRNRYNQVPHLTQDTNRKVTNSQKTPQTRA